MEALFSEELFYIFEDIIDIEDENESLVSDSNSETVINIQPMNAKSLSLGELQQECIKRGLQFSGFADEVRSLQEAFNKENEEYIEQKRREHVEERRKQAETALARLKRNRMNKSLEEERREVESNPYIRHYFELIVKNNSPRFCRLEINDAIGRSLAKSLWTNSSVMELDLSRLSLSDLTGAFISKSLVNNKTMIKIDLSLNRFGWKTIRALAHALTYNTSMLHLNFSSNNLCHLEDNSWSESAQEFALMCSKNKTLRFISFWDCSIGPATAAVLVNGLKANSSLVCFETGFNEFSVDQERFLQRELVANFKVREEELERQRMASEKLEKDEFEKQKVKEKIDRMHESEKWLEHQALIRSNERRLNIEESWRRKQEESQKLQFDKSNVSIEKKGKGKLKKGTKKSKKKKKTKQ